MKQRAASHLAHHHCATPELVEQAVAEVLKQIDAPAGQPIAALFLFLSEDFSPLLESVLQQTLRQTHCLNLHGCISPGLLTEKKWAMDRSAVAVLAIASSSTDQPRHSNSDYAPTFEFLLVPAIRSRNLLWLQHSRYTGPGTLIDNPRMQANIWHGGRIHTLEQIPQTLHLENFSMQYCASENIPDQPVPSVPLATQFSSQFAHDLHQLRQRMAHPPDFGILLPGLAHHLLDESGLDATLTELRAQLPHTPWIGLFNPASPGHLLPITPTSKNLAAHTISPDPSILILAHHV